MIKNNSLFLKPCHVFKTSQIWPVHIYWQRWSSKSKGMETYILMLWWIIVLSTHLKTLTKRFLCLLANEANMCQHQWLLNLGMPHTLAHILKVGVLFPWLCQGIKSVLTNMSPTTLYSLPFSSEYLWMTDLYRSAPLSAAGCRTGATASCRTGATAWCGTGRTA